MVGDLNTHDDLCERLAQYTECTVLSVHYRRTPENRFPAPLDDVAAVLQWLQHMQGTLPFARTRVLLGGDSAGAHLALAMAVRQLQGHPGDAGSARIAGLLLLYPPVVPDADTASMRAYAQGFALTPQAMARYWQELGEPTGSAAQWLRPDLCTDLLPALPPTVLVAASHDILCDEVIAFGQRAQALGAPLQLLTAPGMVHGFARMLASSPAAQREVAHACTQWRALLHTAQAAAA